MKKFEDSARSAHDRRVVAYCDEIVNALGITRPGREMLRKMSLSERSDVIRMQNNGLQTLLQEVGFDPSACPSNLGAPSHGEDLDPQLAFVLEMATAFDNELEFSPYTDVPLSCRLEPEHFDSFENPAIAFVMSVLRPLRRADLMCLVPKLPVLPQIALDILRAVRQNDLTPATIVGFASKDQVLVGGLLACANSAAYGRRREVTNLAHAVSYIGTERAASILIALAVKPTLMTPKLTDLWKHSIEAATAAETMSLLTDGLSRCDAYVLGLIHDVGRLLLDLVPVSVEAARNRLLANGCEIAVAELLTCGMDHAEAGALVLRQWGLPDHYVEAIRFHHQPQATDSKLAALLYLVEFWTDSGEDPASNVRLRAALHRLDLGLTDILHMRTKKPLLT